MAVEAHGENSGTPEMFVSKFQMFSKLEVDRPTTYMIIEAKDMTIDETEVFTTRQCVKSKTPFWTHELNTDK